MRAVEALPLSPVQDEFFRSVTGDRNPPKRPIREAVFLVGRRAGKDSVISGLAAHKAATFNPKGKLRGGELAYVACFASNVVQARIVLGYIRNFFAVIPELAAMVKKETENGLILHNQVAIEVIAGNLRSPRGRTYLLVIADEIAYWWNEQENKNPDREILRAVRPGLMTLSESLLVMITTVYRRQGVPYERWRDYFGVNSDRILVTLAPSRTFNPLLFEEEIQAEIADDPIDGRASYYSEWRDDLASYVLRDVLEAATARGTFVRPYDPANRYIATLDPAEGGSPTADRAAAAITYQKDGVAITAWMKEWVPPFNPAEVIREFAWRCREYHVHRAWSDVHAFEWNKLELKKYPGVPTLEQFDEDSSVRAVEALASLNTGSRVILLDSPNDHLVNEMAALEVRPTAGGKSRVTHATNRHDDLSVAVIAGIWTVLRKGQGLQIKPDHLAQAKVPGSRVLRRRGGTPEYRESIQSRRAAYLASQPTTREPEPVMSPAERYEMLLRNGNYAYRGPYR
jgi:hypothetical protein